MKTQKLNDARVFVIIEAFNDFLEHCYEEKGEYLEVSDIVNDHFAEFIYWAYDDIIINEMERDALLNSKERKLHDRIKKEVSSGILMT